MDFKSYEKAHPEATPLPEYITQEQKAERAREQTRQENAQEVATLKESIKNQLQEGNAPQYILYAALKAIGILSHDAVWAEDCRAQLDAVYSDLAQQSFVVNNNAIAAARLEDLKTKYNEKLRKQLNKDLKDYKRIESSINAILKDLNEIDPPEILPDPERPAGNPGEYGIIDLITQES